MGLGIPCLFLISLIFIGCDQEGSLFAKMPKSADSIKTQKFKGHDSIQNSDSSHTINDAKFIFDPHKSFQVMTTRRVITKQSSLKDTSICKGWTVSKKDIAKVIHDSNPIDGTEWDLTFNVSPCVIAGKLKQEGNSYQFEVNAGSWIYIKCSDTTLILGNYKKGDQKYFLAGLNPD